MTDALEQEMATLDGVDTPQAELRRKQIERDRAVVDLALVTANNIARAFAERRNRHTMRIAQAAVDDDGCGLAVFTGTVVG